MSEKVDFSPFLRAADQVLSRGWEEEDAVFNLYKDLCATNLL